jgi:phage tail sheath gpL-like
MLVSEFADMAAAAMPSNVTEVTGKRSFPVMVTDVPPKLGLPAAGATSVITGRGRTTVAGVGSHIAVEVSRSEAAPPDRRPSPINTVSPPSGAAKNPDLAVGMSAVRDHIPDGGS